MDSPHANVRLQLDAPQGNTKADYANYPYQSQL
jgi:hypothetical protein